MLYKFLHFLFSLKYHSSWSEWRYAKIYSLLPVTQLRPIDHKSQLLFSDSDCPL